MATTADLTVGAAASCRAVENRLLMCQSVQSILDGKYGSDPTTNVEKVQAMDARSRRVQWGFDVAAVFRLVILLPVAAKDACHCVAAGRYASSCASGRGRFCSRDRTYFATTMLELS